MNANNNGSGFGGGFGANKGNSGFGGGFGANNNNGGGFGGGFGANNNNNGGFGGGFGANNNNNGGGFGANKGNGGFGGGFGANNNNGGGFGGGFGANTFSASTGQAGLVAGGFNVLPQQIAQAPYFDVVNKANDIIKKQEEALASRHHSSENEFPELSPLISALYETPIISSSLSRSNSSIADSACWEEKAERYPQKMFPQTVITPEDRQAIQQQLVELHETVPAEGAMKPTTETKQVPVVWNDNTYVLSLPASTTLSQLHECIPTLIPKCPSGISIYSEGEVLLPSSLTIQNLPQNSLLTIISRVSPSSSHENCYYQWNHNTATPIIQNNPPVLSNRDYVMTPSINELSVYPNSELQHVQNVVIERPGVGKIEFQKPVDLQGVVLDDVVAIEPDPNGYPVISVSVFIFIIIFIFIMDMVLLWPYTAFLIITPRFMEISMKTALTTLPEALVLTNLPFSPSTT